MQTCSYLRQSYTQLKERKFWCLELCLYHLWLRELWCQQLVVNLGPPGAKCDSPCMVGTSLQATRPRNQRPVWRHWSILSTQIFSSLEQFLTWARVGGRERVQVSRPETARLRMNRLRGLRWARRPAGRKYCRVENSHWSRFILILRSDWLVSNKGHFLPFAVFFLLSTGFYFVTGGRTQNIKY